MAEQERAGELLDRLFWSPRTCRYGLTTTYLQDYARRHGLEQNALVAEATRRVMYGQYKVFRRFNQQTVFRPNAYSMGNFTRAGAAKKKKRQPGVTLASCPDCPDTKPAEGLD